MLPALTKRLYYLYIVTVLLLFAVISLPVTVFAEEELDAIALSRRLDELYRSKTSRGTMTMQVITPYYKRTLTMKVWSRGMDDTLIRIQSPRKERGTSTLKRGPEMWNYLPKIKKTIRIPPSMMMGSWMGSDFTNDDLMKETSWEEDYSVNFVENHPSGQIGIVYTPKPEAPVTWSRVIVYLDKETKLPLFYEYYDEKNRKVRILEFSEVRDLGGKIIPAKMTLTPLSEDKKGNQTIIIYDEMEFDIELKSDLFSLTSLRRGR